MAALNDALALVLVGVPDADHREIKHAIGRAMAAVAEETIHPATRAFPALDPSQETWIAVAKERACARAASFEADELRPDDA